MSKELIDLLEKRYKTAIEIGKKYVYLSFGEAENILTYLKQQPTEGEFTNMTKKFNKLIEKIKSMFIVSQAMAKNAFDSTLQSLPPVEGETDNPDPIPNHEYPVKAKQ